MRFTTVRTLDPPPTEYQRLGEDDIEVEEGLTLAKAAWLGKPYIIGKVRPWNPEDRSYVLYHDADIILAERVQ